ncbi:aminopeptidase P N-terminal domain-containing protein [soil metagenome]
MNRLFPFAPLAALLLVLPMLASAAAPADYAARRAELARQIGPDSMLILISPPPSRRNGDVDWPYRQEDSLLYLTGQNEPETTLVLLPGEAAHKEIVFSRDSDLSKEVWTGRIAPHEEVAAATGIKEAVSSTKFRPFLSAAFGSGGWGDARSGGVGIKAFRDKVRAGKAMVWLIMEDRGLDGEQSPELKLVEELRRSYPELQFRDAFPLLSAMRSIKDTAELADIQKAIDITVAAQKAAMHRVRTAKHEYEVQATIEYTYRNLGACCWAFPSIVASGRNTTTLHYETNNDPIVPGALLLTDIGAEYNGYSADVARTYPQNGKFSPEQRTVYEAVLRVQTLMMTKMRAGASMVELQKLTGSELGKDLLAMGLVSRNEPAQVGWYFFHGLSHGLGLRTHDVGDGTRVLKAGTIITDEPGIYVRPNDVKQNAAYLALPANERAGIDAALAKYADIGVRIEDDVLVTTGAPKNLSEAAPRTVAEIEAWMAAD